MGWAVVMDPTCRANLILLPPLDWRLTSWLEWVIMTPTRVKFS